MSKVDRTALLQELQALADLFKSRNVKLPTRHFNRLSRPIINKHLDKPDTFQAMLNDYFTINAKVKDYVVTLSNPLEEFISQTSTKLFDLIPKSDSWMAMPLILPFPYEDQ